MRVLSNPAYGSLVYRPVDLVARLRTFCRRGRHEFWAGEVSIRDTKLFNLGFAGGPRLVTDVYLLGLAHRKGGCLATFDRSIPLRAVVGATDDLLQVILPADRA